MEGSVGRGLTVEIEIKLTSALCLVPPSAGSERTQELPAWWRMLLQEHEPPSAESRVYSSVVENRKKIPQEQASQSGRPV